MYSISVVNPNNNELHKLVFEVLPKQDAFIPPNFTEQEKMAWITMFQNEHPVRIAEMDGTPVLNGYTFAYSIGLSCLSSAKTRMLRTRSRLLGLEHIEKNGSNVPELLSSICFNGVFYEPPESHHYWFPETIGYANLPKNAYYFRLSELGDTKAIVARIFENALPFLDKSGTFQHKALILAREDRKGEWTAEKTRSTLFVFEGKCQAILDQDAHLIYSIAERSDIRKIPCATK